MRIAIALVLIFIFTILVCVCGYQIYLFGIEGGFSGSISSRVLVSGGCFNVILLFIITYLVIQVHLLSRLVKSIQSKKDNDRNQTVLKQISQTVRGRSKSPDNEQFSSLNSSFTSKK